MHMSSVTGRPPVPVHQRDSEGGWAEPVPIGLNITNGPSFPSTISLLQVEGQPVPRAAHPPTSKPSHPWMATTAEAGRRLIMNLPSLPKEDGSFRSCSLINDTIEMFY